MCSRYDVYTESLQPCRSVSRHLGKNSLFVATCVGTRSWTGPGHPLSRCDTAKLWPQCSSPVGGSRASDVTYCCASKCQAPRQRCASNGLYRLIVKNITSSFPTVGALRNSRSHTQSQRLGRPFSLAARHPLWAELAIDPANEFIGRGEGHHHPRRDPDLDAGLGIATGPCRRCAAGKGAEAGELDALASDQSVADLGQHLRGQRGGLDLGQPEVHGQCVGQIRSGQVHLGHPLSQPGQVPPRWGGLWGILLLELEHKCFQVLWEVSLKNVAVHAPQGIPKEEDHLFLRKIQAIRQFPWSMLVRNLAHEIVRSALPCTAPD